MLSHHDVLEAMLELIKARFPGETYYADLVPVDFQRPSFLAELTETEMTDASAASIEVTLTVKATAFVVTDEYYNSHAAELIRRQAALQELFATLGIRVGERVLHVISNKGKIGLDYAETTLKLQYHDDRPVEGEWPLMGEVQTIIKEES